MLDEGDRTAARPSVVADNLAALLKVLRFGIVGGTGAATSFVGLWLLVAWVQIPVLWATNLIFVWVCLQNYVLHRAWTFRSASLHRIALPKFLLMNVVGFWINAGLMYVSIEYLRVNYLLAQVIATAAVATWNFILSSLWIFHDGS